MNRRVNQFVPEDLVRRLAKIGWSVETSARRLREVRSAEELKALIEILSKLASMASEISQNYMTKSERRRKDTFDNVLRFRKRDG